MDKQPRPDINDAFAVDPVPSSRDLVDDDLVADVFDEDVGRLDHYVEPAKPIREQELQKRRDYSLAGAGDPDANLDDANFVGQEAVGGGHQPPDQNLVDDIGRAVGIEYQDTEPLGADDKMERRDRDRWELDPASSEDYQERTRIYQENPTPGEPGEFTGRVAEGSEGGQRRPSS